MGGMFFVVLSVAVLLCMHNSDLHASLLVRNIPYSASRVE